MHVNRLALLAAAASFVAACGGAGDDPGRGSTASPSQATTTAASPPAPPRDHSLAELKAALPSKGDVAGAAAVDGVCPEAGVKECGEPDAGVDRVSVSFDLAASPEGSAGDAEQRAAEAIVEDGIYVNVSRFDTADAAATSIATSRATVEKEFGGAIDSGGEKTSFGLPEEGTGTFDDVDLDGWTGFVSARATTVTHDDQTQQIQNAQLVVRSGRVTASANVIVGATGRDPGFAADLARRTVAEYVARLG
ncbi:MAG: hypothetical protein ABWY58_08200 [Aeromicrobium sp.]